MRTLVMGDIHGADKALTQCLGRSGFNSATDTLIQIGDITDKWPGVYECVETLLKIQRSKKLISLRGNHDQWFLDFLTTGIHTTHWQFGGERTIQSYIKNTRAADNSNRPHKNGVDKSLLPQDIPADHKAFFSGQLTYYIDSNNNCFIHAGFNRHLPFNGQNLSDYYCDRKLWTDAMEFETVQANKSDAFYMNTPFREVFIGHTPTTNWYTDKPMHCGNVWNLDTGVGSGGKLTIMDVETKEFWQSDLLPKQEGS